MKKILSTFYIWPKVVKFLETFVECKNCYQQPLHLVDHMVIIFSNITLESQVKWS